MKNYLITSVIILFSFLICGCSSTTSDNVKTSGIYALFTIESKYGHANVLARASLQVGGITGSYIKLVDEDELFCDETKLTMRDGGLGIIEYTAQLPKKNSGEKYVFKFKRKDEEHKVEVTQLKELRIIQPNQSQNLKISQDLKIKWEPTSTEDIDINIDGECIDPYSKILSIDNGEYLIPTGTLKFDEDTDLNRCPVNILIKRYASTNVPKEFEGGMTFSYSISEVNIQLER
ncbi:MAG: hypothetical protein N2746_01245 [Deltaproteobacteria bacterium]|nr:hypothetical protein [Deltaproteobacteria bacterium]